MKRTTVAIASLVLLFSVALQAQAPAPKPGEEHKKLEIFIGDWTYEGEAKATPLGSGGKFSGKISIRPILGGFFLEFRAEDKRAAGTSQWIEIDGYDPVTRKFIFNSFSSNGGITTASYTIDGNTVPYSGTMVSQGKQAKIRGTCIFSADFMSFFEKQELSVEGKMWMPRFELKAMKAQSLPR